MDQPKNFSRRIKAFEHPGQRMNLATGFRLHTEQSALAVKSGKKRWAL
jgi:hypothetical protein